MRFLDRSWGLELAIYTPTRHVDVNQFCRHRMFSSWRIKLMSPETLPNLAIVRSLRIKNGGDFSYSEVQKLSFRKPSLCMLLEISAKLPNLQILKCDIGDDEWSNGLDIEAARFSIQDWAIPRRDSRHKFSRAIQTLQILNLNHVQLDFMHPFHQVEWIDHRLPMPDLVKSAIYDPFSLSLCLLSYRLKAMKSRLVADEALFWPADGSILS